MTPAQFFAQAVPWARLGSARTRVHPSVALAQWADETGFRWPAPGNNPGNVSPGGSVASYASVAGGVSAWVQTMLLPAYSGVRGAQGWQAQCYALGASPWAASHYDADGPPPGEDLVKIVTRYDLTQYDAAPPPPPLPPELEMIPPPWLLEVEGVGFWLVSENLTRVAVASAPDGSAFTTFDLGTAKVSQAQIDLFPEAT